MAAFIACLAYPKIQVVNSDHAGAKIGEDSNDVFIAERKINDEEQAPHDTEIPEIEWKSGYTGFSGNPKLHGPSHDKAAYAGKSN